MNNRYVAGSWNAVCDVCGFEYKSHELKKRWDGYMVCKKDWEPRHPSDFYRARPENVSVPWTRPEPEDVFVPAFGHFAIAGVAVAGFAISGFPPI